MREEDDFVQKVRLCDKAYFYLSVYVNKQNRRYSSTENKEPLRPFKVIVWCEICSNKVIGPYFFEVIDGTTVTLTSERYRQKRIPFAASCLIRF